RIDGGKAHVTEREIVLQHMIANETKSALMESPRSTVKFREAPVGAILSEHPVERAGRHYCSHLIRSAACTP
ncbi:MAG: hypothetical protein WBF47_21460, partial [Xanthobacteraceae bacterium]